MTVRTVMPAITDHYGTLGVARTADDAAIRAAYLASIRRYHPDLNPSRDANDRAAEITAAFDVLRNKDERAAYDRLCLPDHHGSAPLPPIWRQPLILIASSVFMIFLSMFVLAVWFSRTAR